MPMSSKSIEIFGHVTGNKQTDNTTEKCVAISEIAHAVHSK